MEFLDPKKEHRTRLTLMVGYVLVACAIGLATLILLFVSFGFTVDREGEISQQGLVFISSAPTGSTILVDGEPLDVRTNSKLNMLSGDYTFKLTRDGYHDWSHDVIVEGGDVQRYDYPQLFPAKLRPVTVSTLDSEPMISTQSPDKRWLLLRLASQADSFYVYDLRESLKPNQVNVPLPQDILSKADENTSSTWEVVEWADDNVHVLLKRIYFISGTANHEYVLLHRSDPSKTRNLTTDLSIKQSEVVSLFNKQATQFYAYDETSKILRSFSASQTLPIELEGVIAYKTYADDKVVYVSNRTSENKVSESQHTVYLLDGTRRIVLRKFAPTDSKYVLDMAEFDGSWYVGVGQSNGGSGVYIYKNPQRTLLPQARPVVSAWRFMKLQNPVHLSFSANTRFFLASNAEGRVAVSDAERVEIHLYTVAGLAQTELKRLSWKDGHRLFFIDDQRLHVFDFDNTNHVMLQSSEVSPSPVFSGDGRVGYAYVRENNQLKLTMTPYVIQSTN